MTKQLNVANICNLNARFTPSGPDPNDIAEFHTFSRAAQSKLLTLRGRQLSKRKLRFARVVAAKNRAWPILFGILRGELSPEEGGAKLRKAVPDKDVARELFDLWQKGIQTTPEQQAETKRDIRKREKELEKSKQIHIAVKSILRGLSHLSKAAQMGDVEAAEALVKLAIATCRQLYISEKEYPDIFKTLAGNEISWPVLASEDSGWEKDACRRIEKLELGRQVCIFKARFNKPRGAESNLPARRWAKAAVRTIEETQLRFLCFGHLLKEFGGTDGLANAFLRNKWEHGKSANWSRDIAGLGRFSSASFPKWKVTIRKMIREEMPAFHQHDDWKVQRNSAEESGRDTKGEIQNAILDDICSALKRLIPASSLPNVPC